MNEKNIFWLDNISVLYKNDLYTEFIPTNKMSRTEQLNAITRLCIYLIIILFIFDKTNVLIYIPIVCLILVIIFHNISAVQRIKSKYDPIMDKNKKFNEVYTLNEYREYEKGTCRKPTKDNPFMNLTAEDYNKDIAMACNSDDDKIVQTMIDEKFNQDLCRDIEDVFDRKNSERQFFTGTQDIKYDSEKFGRWCYGFTPTCKTNQERCLNYVDYRIM